MTERRTKCLSLPFMNEICFFVNTPPILQPSQRLVPPDSISKTSEGVQVGFCRDDVNTYLLHSNLRDQCGDLLTIVELQPKQCQAKHNPGLHGVLMGWSKERPLHRAGEIGEVLVTGSVGKEIRLRSFAGTLQAPAALFRFPAPSSSQTERKKKNKSPAVCSLSSDTESENTYSGALCWI